MYKLSNKILKYLAMKITYNIYTINRILIRLVNIIDKLRALVVLVSAFYVTDIFRYTSTQYSGINCFAIII